MATMSITTGQRMIIVAFVLVFVSDIAFLLYQRSAGNVSIAALGSLVTVALAALAFVNAIQSGKGRSPVSQRRKIWLFMLVASFILIFGPIAAIEGSIWSLSLGIAGTTMIIAMAILWKR